MNFRIVLEFSADNDEVAQHMPSPDQMTRLIYHEGRFVPKGLLINITNLEIDAF